MYLIEIKGKLWHLLKRSYENSIAAVWVNGLTKLFPIHVGVKQGGILSMLFYNCFVNKLLEGMSNLELGCTIGSIKCPCVTYADDIAVCALHVSYI